MILEVPFCISSWDNRQQFSREVHKVGRRRMQSLPKHWIMPPGGSHPAFPTAGTDEEEKGFEASRYKVSPALKLEIMQAA